ncbi:MAG TPA: DNA-3-methyladenine glycosylase [Bacteroidota bacterium]|nr:DNA-3-methyladenine glycosylase [Bacteroidota bacterium]
MLKTPLPRSFYLRPTLLVAPDLLGRCLVRRYRNTLLAGTIVEVEAYLGRRDPASHSYRGKTERNSVMFGTGGHLYVYFTYGMHFCCNVVTEEEGNGCAVLIRALEPLEGLPVMRKLRGAPAAGDDRLLTNGPAKLCQAFGIGRADNGADLAGDRIYLTRGTPVAGRAVVTSPRIGISEGKEFPFRFYIRGNRFVSRP